MINIVLSHFLDRMYLVQVRVEQRPRDCESIFSFVGEVVCHREQREYVGDGGGGESRAEKL